AAPKSSRSRFRLQIGEDIEDIEHIEDIVAMASRVAWRLSKAAGREAAPAFATLSRSGKCHVCRACHRRRGVSAASLRTNRPGGHAVRLVRGLATARGSFPRPARSPWPDTGVARGMATHADAMACPGGQSEYRLGLGHALTPSLCYLD